MVWPLKCLIIGTPGDVRVKGFQGALESLGHPPAQVIGYPEWALLLEEQRGEHYASVDRVRIESPGRDPAALHAIRWRRQHPSKPIESAPPHAVTAPPDLQAFLFNGMDHLSFENLGQEGPIFLNHPSEIASACDKAVTIEKLACQKLPVPDQLGVAQGLDAGYEHVRDAMRSSGINRVFIKLQHGYSGSGVVAYQHGHNRELATTTVAMQGSEDGVRLFNTRKIRRYQDHQDIRALLDALCPLGVYIERWVPKAGIDNYTADLRVVTIAGRARHIVMRMSRSPITNLHLLNTRSSPEPLKRRMRPRDWDALIGTCEQVARCFPQMLYLGIDVAVHADLRGHTVFEVNAWGDLLHGVTDRGQTTYQAEVEAMADWEGRLD